MSTALVAHRMGTGKAHLVIASLGGFEFFEGLTLTHLACFRWHIKSILIQSACELVQKIASEIGSASL